MGNDRATEIRWDCADWKMKKFLGVLFTLVLALGVSLVTAVPVSAAITNIAVTPADYAAGSTTDYSITFTPDTGEATSVVIDFSAFGSTGTDMVLTGVSTTIGDYSFTGFSVDPTAVTVDDSTKIVTFTGGNTTAVTEHTIVNAVAGTGLVITNDQDAETQNVTISTASDEGTFALTINPGAIDHYAVSAIGSPQVAGTAFNVTIQAQDQYNNDITTGSDAAGNITISFGKPDAGATPTSTSTANGTATVSMTMTVAQTGQSITFTGDTSGKIGTSNNFDVNPGALASFTISGTPATVLAGAAFASPANDITVTAYDACGNVKTDYVGTVTWSSSYAVATLPADYTFVLGDAGAHTFPGNQFRLYAAGSQTITVTDVTALVSATSSGIIVQVLWAAPPPDTTPPIISDKSASNITETSADISWKTNEKSTSQVEYWSSPRLFSPLDETLCYNHLVHLTDLTPGTTYHYKTMSMDSAGNLAVSDEHTFTTLGEAPAAAFSTSDLSISPSEVNIGQTVTISILVANTGNLAGSYEVTLKINDVVEATKEVTVAAAGSQDVSFTTSKEEAGSYSVAVDGVSGSFVVAAPPLAPAAFSVSNLSIQPGEVQPKKPVTITLSVANTGGTEGSYTIVLKINGVKEAEKSVTVAAAGSQDVSFTTSKEEAGSYSVAVDGVSGSFVVSAPPAVKPPFIWPLFCGSTAAVVVVVGLLIFFLIRREMKAA